ncbi:mitochondrial import receptor subunit TOM40B isoform X3 [Calypte anna]|uniref:mitochondrial import receptor subunit TOM40B isoform X3 n=1 Tax=Calypte anna TaxID=9244 RepID=UPI0011C4A7EA|nr:mitochondrial import receptor subunit TOM40B isoform X3 [Calypte anna]
MRRGGYGAGGCHSPSPPAQPMCGERCPHLGWRRRPRADAEGEGASGGGRARGRDGGARRGRGDRAAVGSVRAMGNALGTAAPRGPRRGEPLGSPGSFDELHRQCKEVFPQQMEGVKLIVNKTLSSHFQVTHMVHMSTLGPSNYHFNATFVGDRQLSPTEVFPTLVGDMDNSGSLNAQVLQLVAERIRTKAVFQTHQAKFVTWQFDGEYRGDDCTATLTLGNPDLLGESAQKWVATLNVGYGGAHASYYHRANEQVQVGVELEANTRLQDTTFAFGYQLNLPQANMVFRGLLDSNWSVGGVLEKKLPPLPVTLALGAFLNHWKNRFHCGFSVIVG